MNFMHNMLRYYIIKKFIWEKKMYVVNPSPQKTKKYLDYYYIFLIKLSLNKI